MPKCRENALPDEPGRSGMYYLGFDDFLEQAGKEERLLREDEISLAQEMTRGDLCARERLIRGYLPQVAGAISRVALEYRTLELVMRCCGALERAVDGFDFLQDSESFSHRLSWVLRQTVVGYIAHKRNPDE